eukprot:2127666-Rhodomonas_salina.5
MSGTDMGCMVLTMSGTDTWAVLRVCYAMSGTEIGYAATRSAGGILGDEMGLGTAPYAPMSCSVLLLPPPGKTLQMISFFGFLKTVRGNLHFFGSSHAFARRVAVLREGMLLPGEQGPHLVVAPLSVMNAWVGECEKWCPSLNVVTFHGSHSPAMALRACFVTSGTDLGYAATRSVAERERIR